MAVDNSWFLERAERARITWSDTIAGLPVGAVVTGQVDARRPFGVFITIDGHPDALGLMEITRLPRGMDLPDPGARVDAVVIDHAEHNWQVRLAPTPGE